MSNRGQHQEFWRRQSQIRLLCPWPLRAVTAGRGHYQDSLQKRPQWMVEGGGLRPGETSASSHRWERWWWNSNDTRMCPGLLLNVNCVCCQVGFFPANYVDEDSSEYCWCACRDVYTQYLYTFNILYFGWDRTALLFWACMRGDELVT